MKVQVQKWGNSLALRIPKALAVQSKIEQGTAVEVMVEDGALVVKPVRAPKYTLEELLARVTPENLHGEVDFGRPVGKEIWWADEDS